MDYIEYSRDQFKVSGMTLSRHCSHNSESDLLRSSTPLTKVSRFLGIAHVSQQGALFTLSLIIKRAM